MRVRIASEEVLVTRSEVLKRKRFPRWAVGLMLVGAVFGGVACEGNVEGDVDTENGGGENGGGDDGGGGVDGDVELDTDTEGEGGGD